MIDGKYEPRDLEALRKSINHWQNDNVGKESPNAIRVSDIECALCQLYLVGEPFIGANCVGCPVMNRTGKASCYGTPYREVSTLLKGWKDAKSKPPDFEGAVQREISFLQELYKEALIAQTIVAEDSYQKGYIDGQASSKRTAFKVEKVEVPKVQFNKGDIVEYTYPMQDMKVCKIIERDENGWIRWQDKEGVIYANFINDVNENSRLELLFPASRVPTQAAQDSVSCKSKGDIVRLEEPGTIGMVTAISTMIEGKITISVLCWYPKENVFICNHMNRHRVKEIIWKGEEL